VDELLFVDVASRVFFAGELGEHFFDDICKFEKEI
jgi:hypothetical protein